MRKAVCVKQGKAIYIGTTDTISWEAKREISLLFKFQRTILSNIQI